MLNTAFDLCKMFYGGGRVEAGALSPVVAVRVEDGSPSLNILQTFGF